MPFRFIFHFVCLLLLSSENSDSASAVLASSQPRPARRVTQPAPKRVTQSPKKKSTPQPKATTAQSPHSESEEDGEVYEVESIRDHEVRKGQTFFFVKVS
jgi:hypothetical protein